MDHDPTGACASGELPESTPAGVGIHHDYARLPYGAPFPAVFALSGPVLPKFFWFALFAAGVLALCWLTWRKRQLPHERPDPWADPGTLDDILVLAMDQRAPISLHLPAPDSAPLKGTCLGLDRNSLSVQLNDAAAAAGDWPGRELDAFFCLCLGQSLRLYRFRSLALRRDTEGGATLLQLVRPSRLEPFQRRAWPRVSLRRAQTAALGLWNAPGSSTGDSFRARNHASRPGQAGPAGLSGLPAPLLVCRPPHKETVHLANISASGLGLRMSRQRALDLAPACLVFLSLDNRRGEPLNLWLACARRHVTAVSGRNTAMVGLQFLEWGRVADADSAIHWQPNGAEGEIVPLKRWVIRLLAAEGRPAGYLNLLTKE